SRLAGVGPDCAKTYGVDRSTEHRRNPFAPAHDHNALLRNAPYIPAARSLFSTRFSTPSASSASLPSDQQLTALANFRVTDDTPGTAPVTLPLWLAGPISDFLSIMGEGAEETAVRDLPTSRFTLDCLVDFDRWLSNEPDYGVWFTKLVTGHANNKEFHHVQALMQLHADLNFLSLPDLEQRVFTDIQIFFNLPGNETLHNIITLFGSDVPLYKLPLEPSTDRLDQTVRYLEDALRSDSEVSIEMSSDEDHADVGGNSSDVGEGGGGRGGNRGVRTLEGEEVAGAAEAAVGGNVPQPSVGRLVDLTADSSSEDCDDSGMHSDVPLSSFIGKVKGKGKRKRSLTPGEGNGSVVGEGGKERSISHFKRCRLAEGKVEVWNVDRKGVKTGKKMGLTPKEIRRLYETYCIP
ncbi:hypothetical protein HDV00_009104, partial [Rhizophlyctis rosea]